MRRPRIVLPGMVLPGMVLVAAALSGCGPAVTAVSAIGYDERGRLVGAAKICSGDLTLARLAPAAEDADDLTAWRRDATPPAGTEHWVLAAAATPHWERTGPVVPDLTADPDAQFVFFLDSPVHAPRGDLLTFRGSDLAALSPGQVLVQRDGPLDEDGFVTTVLAVTDLDDLAAEPC